MLTPQELDEIIFQVLISGVSSRKNLWRPITEQTVVRLMCQARDAFEEESTLIDVPGNIAIVGDIHGNIDDLLRIFEKFRYPPTSRYLFLGDYVDRGEYGAEVLLFLFAMKLKYPMNIYMLRGNHETESMTRAYEFCDEMTDKYGEYAYERTLQVFQALPLAAVVGERVFCVHGGISPELRLLSDIERLKKPVDLSAPGLFTDMAWSDPLVDAVEFERNERGCGYIFGPDVLADFLRDNHLDVMIRGHEACANGIAWPYAENESNVDNCLTVFSSSDYCRNGNTAAVIHIAHDLAMNVEVFPPTDDLSVVIPNWLSHLIPQRPATSKFGYGAKAANMSANGNENTENALLV